MGKHLRKTLWAGYMGRQRFDFFLFFFFFFFSSFSVSRTTASIQVIQLLIL